MMYSPAVAEGISGAIIAVSVPTESTPRMRYQLLSSFRSVTGGTATNALARPIISPSASNL